MEVLVEKTLVTEVGTTAGVEDFQHGRRIAVRLRFIEDMLRSVMEGRFSRSPSTVAGARSIPARRCAGLLCLVGVLLSVLIQAPGAPAGADERSDREAVRQKKAAAAAGLDGLKASDDQLEQAVATLDANVRTQNARLEDANLALAAADQEVSRLQASISEREQELTKLQDDVRRRAVELYVNPMGRYDQASLVLEAKTSSEAVRKRVLVDSADRSGADTVDRYRALRAALEDEKVRASAAAAEASQRRDAQASQVREVEGALAAQRKARRDLDQRIYAFQQEVDALAADEARLTEVIRRNDEAVAQRAREEKARREAAEQAAIARAAAPPPSSGAAPGSSPMPAGSLSSSSNSGPARAPAPPPSSGGRRVMWPTAGTVTSEYGQRWGRLHAGIDISAPSGTPIQAAAGGTVISAGWGGGYGNLVVIDHGGGFTTAYAHQSRIAVSNGQAVSQGQLIGYVGTTGSSTGDHLHFECRINGSAQNPRGFL